MQMFTDISLCGYSWTALTPTIHFPSNPFNASEWVLIDQLRNGTRFTKTLQWYPSKVVVNSGDDCIAVNVDADVLEDRDCSYTFFYPVCEYFEVEKEQTCALVGGIWSVATDSCFKIHPETSNMFWVDAWSICIGSAPCGFRGRLVQCPSQTVFDQFAPETGSLLSCSNCFIGAWAPNEPATTAFAEHEWVWRDQFKNGTYITKPLSDGYRTAAVSVDDRGQCMKVNVQPANEWYEDISCGFQAGAYCEYLSLPGGRDKPKYVLCMCFSEWGEVLSGDSNGTISVWDWKTGRTCRQVAKVHQGGVFALCSLRGGRLLSGGGKDRRILEWTADLKPTGRSTEVPESAGPVRTISQGKGSLILIGTTHNAILQGSVDLGFSFIAQGHIDELWGLCSHPLQQQFLTCGYDKTLRLWDSISHCLVWVKEIGDPAYCSCFHPDGSIFVVGTTIGRWLVLDATTRDVVIAQKDGNDIISSPNYSPDGRMLAVASHDGNVYVYSVSDDARRYYRTHASFVTAVDVDWSADGQFLRTNSGDHEVLFWYAIQCKALFTPSSVRDVQWATDWCTLSFQVFGAWPDGADGTEINACAASHDRQLLAVADDAGSVRILRYPSSQPKSSSNSYSGHSSHVTSVRFLANDSRLISIGGKDSAVFQCTVTKLS